VQQAIAAELELRHVAVVPLQARGRVQGVLVLGSTSPAGWPADHDREASDLAGRCALAIDNAQLYRTSQQAVSARDQFLSIASHELRAPLARLKSHAEVLLMAHEQGQLDPERLAWSVQRINASVDRLATLTKDVLDLSRLRAGHFPFRPKAVDLSSLLHDLEPRLADIVGERHVLHLDLTDEPCPVLVDQDRVEQLLGNLLDNAGKYSPDGGDIVLRVRPMDDGVLVSVRDEGVGLPTGSHELIFEAFGRATNAEQWNVPGMGLGLHICRIIVERHGGRIWAESQGEQQGTTVTLWLPFAEESPMSAGDVKQRLSNQLTLALGYCELLATNPELPAGLRAQALGAMHGAQGAAATLENL
jgi:signal transduction histidine kinase